MGRMGKTLVQLLLLAGWDVDFWKVALQSFFAEKRIEEIDAKIYANISADGKGIYIHPTFVICWVECRLVYN